MNGKGVGSLLNKHAIAGILLAAGCPVLLWASTLSSRVDCKVDVQAKTITPVQYRPESFPFLLMLGMAQGFGAWQLLKGKGQTQAIALGGSEPVGSLPEGEGDAFVADPSQLEPVSVSGERLTVSATLEPVPPVENAIDDEKVPSYDVATDLGGSRASRKLPQNCLILGTPGAGKGIVMSNSVRALKREYPELFIFGIDPKAQESEDGLWEVGDRAFTQVERKPIMGMSPEEVAKWLGAAIRTYMRIPASQPSMLVVDELNAIKASLDNIPRDSKYKQVGGWLNTLLTHLISLGDGSGKWFLGIAQNGQGEALPFSTSVRNNLRTVAIVSMDNIGAVQGLLRTDVIPQNCRDIKVVEGAVNASPVKRAFYDRKTNTWNAMPVLKNYGLDRNPFARSASSNPQTPGTREPSPVQSVNDMPSIDLDRDSSDGSEVQTIEEPLIRPLDPCLKTDGLISDRISELRKAKMNQDQIILSVWGCKKGGSPRYQAAVLEYKRLTQEN